MCLAAVVGLTNLGPKAAAVLPQLVDLTQDEEIQENVLRIISRVGVPKDEKDIATIAELMEVETGYTAVSTAITLNRMGKPAVPALIKKLSSGKATTRRLATDVHSPT